MLIITSQKLPQCKGVQEGIAAAMLRTIDVKQVFTNLEDHMLDCIITENHIFLLIKVAAKIYCKIKLYHLGKEKTQTISSDRIRHKFSKLILFNHQQKHFLLSPTSL